MKHILNLLLFLLIAAGAVSADGRKYVWTYQYGTTSPDETELGFYQTTQLAAVDNWEYRIEIERGLNSSSDLAVYQIFSQTGNGALTWDAFQVRLRHKLAAEGHWLVDPLLYLEYRRKTDTKGLNKLEGKLVLTREIGRVDISVNPVYEFFWEPGGRMHEIGVDAGLSYELLHHLSVGIESSNRHALSGSISSPDSWYLGPTVSVTARSIYYTLGYAVGITKDSDDARVRFLIGIEL